LQPIDVGGISTTEICNLSCVMCHFNGPTATKLQGTLTVEDVRKFVSSVPAGSLWFASTGDFLMDPNALEHLRTAVSYGHQPCVLTNGQMLTPEMTDHMLEIGVREIAISVDAIEPGSYRRIRRGGELSTILDVCSYLRSKKSAYPDLIVTIANVLFKRTLMRQEEFERFWTGRVDRVSFQAEYYDTFKFRNILYDPGDRVDCHLRVFLMPNGKMTPCCAISVYQHDRDVEWLPNIRDTTPTAALERFKELYSDRRSALGELCQQCDWWMMFKQGTDGTSAFSRTASLPDLPEGASPEMPGMEERFGVFDLREVTACNQAEIHGGGPMSITTPPEQWAFAALFPIHDDAEWPLVETGPVLIHIEALVEQGEVGVSIAEPTLGKFIAVEKRAVPGGVKTIEVSLKSPAPGCWLVVRNTASGGRPSKVDIHSIRTFLATSPKADQPSGFVPLKSLTPKGAEGVEATASTREAGGEGIDVSETAEPDEIWLDVGAHLGEKTFSFAAQNPNTRVYAFEPNLKTASKLMGRLPNYVVIPMAVSEQDGSAPFYLNRFDAASSLLPFVPEGLAQWAGGEILQVEATPTVATIRLDTFLNQASIATVDYLKIDAQGADLAVVRSLGDRLKDVRRVNLEVQITPVPLYRGASQKSEVVEFLTNAGFELVAKEEQSLGQEENLTFIRRTARVNRLL
jgi:FkbM family methyltransferase